MENNPLLEQWNTPFGTPPFDLIKTSHFSEAIREAVRIAQDEINHIVSSKEPPDFENTVVALERSGELLGKVTLILFNLNSAETSKELQVVAQEAAPVLTRFSNDITLNPVLFERISKIFEKRNEANLDGEQMQLLEKRYLSFVLGGAALKEEQKKRFREITEELATLSLKFDENVLEETNNWELIITDRNELEGLPESIIESAENEAREKNIEGWKFTLHYPSYIPFLKYSDRRELREKMFRAYSSRAFHGNEYDNRDIILKIVNLRLELAKLLGFKNYAEMALTDRMADTPEKVYDLLSRLHDASRPAAFRDFENIRNIAARNGFSGNIERWDWAYYSEKLKKELYDFDDELLKPYFRLENVEKAIFELARSLYGLTFKVNTAIPLYHEEVKTFEVFDEDGFFLAILYLDYYPRPGKSGGAWMTTYREQKKPDGKDLRPLVSIVTNFTRPSETRPSLLSFSELTTFLHEFGHALHGMMSRCSYESLSGTNVARDFVELPSQFMENYAYEKEWLDKWAFHYQTGEKIPEHIIRKIKETSKFNEGYACYRQLGFGFLDMEWHTIESPVTMDVPGFERNISKKTELFPETEGINMSCSFSHIFGGGYAAGYYGYKWAEVLDADAFSYFTEKGIFSSELASSFRKNILEKGGSAKPMDLYIRFRGKEPSIEPLLKRGGLT